MKPIRLSKHALGYIPLRGFTVEEVEAAINSEPWHPASQGQGRLECRRNFAFGRDWNGKFYATKQVRPIFAERTNEIVVVTVYTYYF